MATTQPTSAKPKRRYWPRTWRGYLGLFLGFMVVLAFTGWMLSRATPPWHRPMDPSDNAVIDGYERAWNNFLELHNVIQRVPLGEQHWSVTQDEMNCSLASIFAPPLNEQGIRVDPSPPALISEPVIVFSPGKVTVSARSSRIPSGNPRGGVGTVVFTVEMVQSSTGAPMCLVKVQSVWIGYVPVPRSLAIDRVKAMIPAIARGATETARQKNSGDVVKALTQMEAVMQAVVEEQPFPLEYVIDRRPIVITDLAAEEGTFRVSLSPPLPQLPLTRVPATATGRVTQGR